MVTRVAQGVRSRLAAALNARHAVMITTEAARYQPVGAVPAEMTPSVHVQTVRQHWEHVV